jgi:small subunit ribosomal protein S18
MSDQGSGSRRDDRDRDRDRDRDGGGRGRGGSSSGGPGGGGAGGRRFYRRKKVDYFSVNKIDHISYRDADMLRQFLGDGGKILPRRHTGLSAQNQRLLKRAIKRARNIALLPFGGTDS